MLLSRIKSSALCMLDSLIFQILNAELTLIGESSWRQKWLALCLLCLTYSKYIENTQWCTYAGEPMIGEGIWLQAMLGWRLVSLDGEQCALNNIVEYQMHVNHYSDITLLL